MIPTVGQLAGEEPEDIKDLTKECWEWLLLLAAVFLLSFFAGIAYGTYFATH